MAQITIEINDETYENLINQAQSKGLKPEEELQLMLEKHIKPPESNKITKEEFISWSRDFKKQVGPQKSDSTDIIRELRENL